MENEFTLKDKIVLVTGGSRGIGKGIAIALSKFGATVFITGRPQKSPNKLGSIEETAEAVTNAGGIGHAIYCDHAIDEEVAAVFESIKKEAGHIDILVNNVTTLANDILYPPPFWTKSIQLADQITVGLRSAYVSSYYAAPLLLKSKKSSTYLHSCWKGKLFLSSCTEQQDLKIRAAGKNFLLQNILLLP